MAERKATLSPQEYYKMISKEDKSVLVDLQDRKPIDFIPTGSWPINSAIGDGTMTDKPGGFPRGHITEIFGEESSGKTTLLLSGIKQAQEMGLVCVLLDYEQTFHPGYAEKIGVSLDKNKLIVLQPLHFEQGIRNVLDALNMRPGIIGIDSVSAMTPKAYLEGAVDEIGRIGLQAQLMSTFMSLVTKRLKESNTCLIFNNQMRTVINTGPSYMNRGPKQDSSGGLALKYYSSVRLKMTKGEVEKIEKVSKITGKKEKEPVNITVWVSVVKNKIDKPFKKVPVYIKFGEGFDNILSIIQLAISSGVIEKSGAFYTFKHAGETLIKAHGTQQLWDILNQNEKLLKRLQDSLVFKEDDTIKEEYKATQDVSEDDVDALLENVSKTFIEKSELRKKRNKPEND